MSKFIHKHAYARLSFMVPLAAQLQGGLQDDHNQCFSQCLVEGRKQKLQD